MALARSLILNPKVLLLDEPLSALDPVFHDEARSLLKKVHKDLDMTIIMVSHNFEEVLYLANRGAIIRDGKIMQQGSIQTLFEKPDSRFTARFVGMKNIAAFEHRLYGVFTRVHMDVQGVFFEAVWPRNLVNEFCLEVGKTAAFEFHSASVHTF